MSLADVSVVLSNFFLLFIIFAIVLVAYLQKIDVFAVFVTGAREGFEVAIRIIPYLVGFMVAVGMFRASGGFNAVAELFSPMLAVLGVPFDVLAVGLLRPFSGGAATALLGDIAHTHGTESLITLMVAILMGSTETTFYVLMVYFGAVGIKDSRHAVAVGLLADLAAIVAAVFIGRLFFT